MKDLTEIALALISLTVVATLVVNARGTATVAQGVGGAFEGLLRAASFQGAGNSYGMGY